MRYVITGASGHLGNNFVRYVNSVGDETVISLTRRKVEKELLGARYIEKIGDLFSREFLEENILSSDVVIHFAGYIDLTDKDKEQTYKINVELTKLICDVCLRKGVKKFIYVGSVDGLDHTVPYENITEPEKYDSENVKGNYGKSKALAMQYVKTVMDNNPDFSVNIVMPSAVIGENDFKPSAVGKIIKNVINKKAQFGVKGGYNFVDVYEVVRAIYTLSNSDIKGDFILSGENVTIKEFYHLICKALGRKARPIILPTFLVKMFLPFTKMLNKITLKALTEPHDYSSKKAIDTFGYKITNKELLIEKTTKWFIKNEN